MFPLHRILGFVSEAIKIAEITTPLKAHQKRVVDKIQHPDQPGLVVAHGLGSGKTLTSIAAIDALGKPTTVVVPAALQDNYKKELQQHTKGKLPKINIKSMQDMASKGKAPKDPVMVVDEAHRARAPESETNKTLKKNKADKRLLLTASPFYNHPADIAPLVNIAAGADILPASKAEFSQKYISELTVPPTLMDRVKGLEPGVIETINPNAKRELKKTLSKWVDYHPSSSEDYPKVKRQDVKVPMTDDQLLMYDTIMKGAPSWVAKKIKAGLPPSKKESKQLNAFLTGTRQISNTTAPFQTSGDSHDPKIEKAFKELKKALKNNDQAKAVIYSNYLEAGLRPYKQRLQEEGVQFGEFTGDMDKTHRDELVRRYNENKIQALLLSSAGGEGLDLKGTRLMQILEPHWNLEKIKQVEGRGVRYKSHEGLPPEDREVLIQRFLATRPRKTLLERLRLKKPGGSVDEYLARMSENKERLIKDFRGLLKEDTSKTR